MPEIKALDPLSDHDIVADIECGSAVRMDKASTIQYSDSAACE